MTPRAGMERCRWKVDGIAIAILKAPDSRSGSLVRQFAPSVTVAWPSDAGHRSVTDSP